MQPTRSIMAVVTVLVAFGVHGAARAQSPSSSKPSSQPEPMTMTGCVSGKPAASGQFTFADDAGAQQYRLTGKSVRKYAGQKVELVIGTPRKGVAVRGGLWPSPNAAARGADLDPAQESIARQPGGGGAPVPSELPELRVSRVRAVEGSCQ